MKKIIVIAICLVSFLVILWYMNKQCSVNKENFGGVKFTETLLKNIPEVMERSRNYPTIDRPSGGVLEKFNNVFSSPPVRSYGTLLKSVPQVNALSKKFATARSGKFKGTDDIVLPTKFDGRVFWKDYLTPVSSQGSCGNCWAHATTSALADRFAIFSMGKIKFVPSPYEITVCAHKFTNIKEQWGNKEALELMDDYLHGRKVDPTNALQSAACEGASLFTAAEVLYTDGVPSEECFPAKGSVGMGSYDVSSTPVENPSELPYCHTLETMDFDTCIDQKTAAKKYRAKTAYNVGDPLKDSLDELEHAIMYEIYKRGPIPTGFMVFSDFMDSFDGKTVYTHMDKSSYSNGGHAVKMVGWGDDGVDSLGNTGIPYWILQNSWGSEWGEGGFFKFKRKIPECQMEQNAMGMLPDFPGMEINDPNIIPIQTETDIEGIKEFPGHYLDPYTGYYLSGIEKIRSCVLKGDVVPYIDPTIPLPNYSTFYAGQVDDYISKNPIPITPPLVPSVVCGTSTPVVQPTPIVQPTPVVQPTPSTTNESTTTKSTQNTITARQIYDYVISNTYLLTAVLIIIVLISGTIVWKVADFLSGDDSKPLSSLTVISPPIAPTFNGYVGRSFI